MKKKNLRGAQIEIERKTESEKSREIERDREEVEAENRKKSNYKKTFRVSKCADWDQYTRTYYINQ